MLWISLFTEYSLLDADLLAFFSRCIKNLRKHFKSDVIKIKKVDFKIDSYGSFFSFDLARHLQMFEDGLNDGLIDYIWEKSMIDADFDEDPEKLYVTTTNHWQINTFFNAMIGRKIDYKF